MALVVGIWFFIRRLFRSVDTSSHDIHQLELQIHQIEMRLMVASKDLNHEIGKLQGENERQWKNIAEIKKELEELGE